LKIFNSIQDFTATAKTVVTLGTFDGVHRGHKSILDRLIQSSKNCGCESIVLTFFPHPRMVLQQNTDIRLLNTMPEKALLLENHGIDNLIIHPFNQEFSQLTAEEFVRDILVARLNIHKIIIGHDHRFGRGRTATIHDLIRYGEAYGFEVEQISPLEVNEVLVSSTKIRNALTAGNLSTASKYLGYTYFFTGIVVQGKQLGRTLNFPTANFKVTDDYKLIPASGVYTVSSVISNTTVYGMMSIGTNPTVGGTQQTIEVNYLDFNDDLYGRELTVRIYHRLRDEVKFSSLAALTLQLKQDRLDTIAYFKNNS